MSGNPSFSRMLSGCLLAAGAMWLSIPPLHAETSAATAESYHRLLEAMRSEIRANLGKPEEAKQMNLLLDEVQESYELPVPFGHALSGIEFYYTTDAVLTETARVRDLAQHDDEAEQEAIAQARQDKQARIRETLRSAKVPSDLDAVAEELSSIDIPEVPSNAQSSGRMLDFYNAKLYVGKWQEYLACTGEGDAQKAYAILSHLIFINSRFYSPFPRSRLMEWANPVGVSDEDFSRLVLGATSLDDVEGIVTACESGKEGRQLPLTESAYYLRELGIRYREMKAGLSPSWETMQPPRGEGAVAAKLRELYIMFVKQALPPSLGLTGSDAATDSESVSAFLDRIIQEARVRDDLPVALKARLVKISLASGTKESPVDTKAVTAYLAGKSQETAGEFALAVLSYQRALASGSDLVSSERIGARLEEIRQAHAEDYRRGFEEFLKTLRTVEIRDDSTY